jgi:branched-chain amino acid transport system substrate-binding protein
MVRSIRLTAVVAAAATLLVAAAACSSDDNPGGTTEVFKIGAVAPLSGQYAAIGTGIKEGLELGAEEVNANGGIMGRHVEVTTLDSAGDPARGLAAAQQLIDRDHVDFLYPDVFPNVVLAILQYTTAKKLVTVTAGAVPALTEIAKYPYSFSLGTPFDAYNEQMAEQFKAVDAKDIGLLVTDDTSGQAFTAVWQRDFPAAGLNIKAVETYSPTATDVTTTLQRLRGANVEAIAFYGAGTQTSAVMQGIEAIGWDIPVIAQNSSVTGDLSTLIPAGVQDQFRAVALRILGRSAPDKVDAEFAPFVDKLKQAGPIVSLTGSAASRDIVLVLKWAFEKANSTEGDAVRAALESSGSSSPDLDLINGPAPAFSTTDHSMASTEYPAETLTVIRPSTPLDGTYQILSGS